MRILIAALLLAGCVSESTPVSIEYGRWASYHDMMVGLGKYAVKDKAAPESVKDAFAACFANYVDKFVLPDERPTLDAYARGEKEMTLGEATRMDQQIQSRAGGQITDARLGVLSDTCPNDVASFHQLNL